MSLHVPLGYTARLLIELIPHPRSPTTCINKDLEIIYNKVYCRPKKKGRIMESVAVLPCEILLGLLF